MSAPDTSAAQRAHAMEPARSEILGMVQGLTRDT